MVFQVLLPKQLSALVVGCHRLQFIYQTPDIFQKTNRPDWLSQLKSDTGYAQVAGIELTLLDSIRYFHKTGGLNGVAQIVHDLGAYAHTRQLGKVAQAYENSVVRRLGYLLDIHDHSPQANALLPLVARAKSFKPLNPAVNPVSKCLPCPLEKNEKWKLVINEFVEIES